MIRTLKWLIAFLLGLIVWLPLPVLAQNGSGPAKPSSPDPALVLTEKEKTSRVELEARFRPIQEEINSAIRAIISSESDEKILVAAYKLKLADQKASAIRSESINWLREVLKAHGCEECQLDGDNLVKAKPTVK